MKKLQESFKVFKEKLGRNDKKAIVMMLVAAIAVISLVIGATYAFFQAQGGTSGSAAIEAKTATVDNLVFGTCDGISITADMSNFNESSGSIKKETCATAILTASTTASATYYYDISINVEANEFTYSIDSTTPELLLKVTDPDGNEVTSISGLTYYSSVTDREGNTHSGFDITTLSDDNILVKKDEITASVGDTVTEKWVIEVTFVNYDADQQKNTGKNFDADIVISKNSSGQSVSKVGIYFTTANASLGTTTPATLTCDGGTYNYNNKTQTIEISQVDADLTNCSLTYNEQTEKTYLNDYVISLAGTTQGNGEVVSENGYRYEGMNPNNYVWFNNELWRIIGVFDETSHGQTGENLVKLIKEDSIGALVYDTAKGNDWSTASLNKLLNGSYYNATDGTNSGYCYSYSTTVGVNCDYTTKGISSAYRGMIKNVTWYLGGTSTYSGTADTFYSAERGTEVYSGHNTTATGYIGLAYPSDYGYAALASSCARTTVITSSSYSSTACGGSDWMLKDDEVWFISPYSYCKDYVFGAWYNGRVSDFSATHGLATRPVLYLDSSVYRYSGTGSVSDPIIIGM